MTAPDTTKLKSAAFAREYGASELMLATMTGRYPPPHVAMDERVNLDILQEETDSFDDLFLETFQ